MQAGDDANTAFDRHCQTECDPSNYARVHKKPRCPVPGCKEKLTSVNTYTCRDCGTTVCLRHRLASDHKCQGKVAAAAAAQSRFALPQAFKGLFSGPSSQASSARNAVPQPGRSAGTGAVAAAAKTSTGTSNGNITDQLQRYRTEQQRRAVVPAGAAGSVGGAGPRDVLDLTSPTRPAAGNSGPEVCQQCGARFATVQQLIAHAEQAHLGGGGPANPAASSQHWPGQAQQQQRQQRSGGGHGELERCPHCGQQFADAVELVSHVERVHASSQKDGCVLC
ncbi:hypothetical protein N2152v2_003899 [Parachlorella kessleri]